MFQLMQLDRTNKNSKYSGRYMSYTDVIENVPRHVRNQICFGRIPMNEPIEIFYEYDIDLLQRAFIKRYPHDCFIITGTRHEPN